MKKSQKDLNVLSVSEMGNPFYFAIFSANKEFGEFYAILSLAQRQFCKENGEEVGN